MRLYRQFLSEVKRGSRRLEAATALSQLRSQRASLGEDPSEGEAENGNPAPTKKATRVLVSSPTEGAVLRIDGKRAKENPLIQTVKPGVHRIEVSAPGFRTETHQLTSVAGSLRALEVTLKPKPAKLRIKTQSGADIYINGKRSAQAPATTPFSLPAGKHFISIAQSGYLPSARYAELARDEQRALSFPLQRSTQRRLALGGFITAGASALLSGGMTGAAFFAQGKASSIAAVEGSISEQARLDYNDWVRARDRYVITAVSAGGLSGALAIASTLLYIFDAPQVIQPELAQNGVRWRF